MEVLIHLNLPDIRKGIWRQSLTHPSLKKKNKKLRKKDSQTVKWKKVTIYLLSLSFVSVCLCSNSAVRSKCSLVSNAYIQSAGQFYQHL